MYVDVLTLAAWGVVAASAAAGIVLAYGARWAGAPSSAGVDVTLPSDDRIAGSKDEAAANDRDRFSDAA